MEEKKEKTQRLPEVTEQEFEVFNNTNKKVVREFLDQGHLSPQTLKQYKSALYRFFKYIFDYCDNKPINKCRPKDAISYQNWLKKQGLSPAAIKMRRAAVSSLCNYLETFYLEEEGFENFRNIYNKRVPNVAKQDVREKKPMNAEEFSLLLKTLEERGEWQMIAYLKFTYASGCRRAETRQLLKEVVDYEMVPGKNYYLTHPVRTKGRGDLGKIRSLVFDQEAKDAIIKWLEVRGEDSCPYVFVTKRNGKVEQVSESTFNYWCADVFSKIINRRVHPHQIREQRATDLVVTQLKDIKTVKALLGHESVQTSEIYVIRPVENDVDDAFGS